MNGFVAAALYGWLPFVLVVFAVLPATRAAALCYVAGWCFLPVGGFETVSGFDYTKSTAVPLAVFAALVLFDLPRLRSVRLSPFDLPIAVWCAAPFVSSLANDLGAFDALSALFYRVVTWGLPYATGRACFRDAAGTRTLAYAIVAGGLVYVPLCLWEVRMSPQLHAAVYGFHQHDWTQTLRLGGYRPMVFMQHGLMVALWMGAAALIAWAAWFGRGRRSVFGVPLFVAAPLLLVTLLVCKSFGAVALTAAGLAALLMMRGLRTSLPMAVLVALPFVHVGLRTVGGWTGAPLTELVATVDPDRADSLAYRLAAENVLRERAAERPLLGWGGWGRSFVGRGQDARTAEPLVTDSLWIIAYGQNGALGLAALLCVFAAPIVALWSRCPPRLWALPGATLPWALALVLGVFALDCLVNAMVNPVYLVVAGALSTPRGARRRTALRAPHLVTPRSPLHDRTAALAVRRTRPAARRTTPSPLAPRRR